MRSISLTGMLVFCFFISLQAQTNEKESILKPVRLLFEGMQKGDSSEAHRAFYDQATMATILKDKNGKPVLQREPSIDSFLKAIGTPHTEKYNEVVWNEKIEADGNFAQVWMNYAFYAGKKFSHCGVDAFHLFKNKKGDWQIFHLADTRQKDNCSIPKEIQEQFK
ncbi:MAG: nuclear transport factor 2 family protein [Bacteroidetes bacterium]|nr:nuclear transport factor 2 family protein [Bacteroidota bacterium]